MGAFKNGCLAAVKSSRITYKDYHLPLSFNHQCFGCEKKKDGGTGVVSRNLYGYDRCFKPISCTQFISYVPLEDCRKADTVEQRGAPGPPCVFRIVPGLVPGPTL